MTKHSDNVTIELELPRAEYERVEAQARKEHRSVSQVIPVLLHSELRRREKARRMLEEVSESYRELLASEGKLDQAPEEVLAELRQLRDEVANELFPA